MPTFTSPPDPIIFNHLIWGIVCRIPVGEVATYGQITRKILPLEGVEAKGYLSLGPCWAGSAMEGMKKWMG